MNNNEELDDDIYDITLKHKPAYEGNPVKSVRLPWFRFITWKKEKEGVAEDFLKEMKANSMNFGWQNISRRMLDTGRISSFERKKSSTGETERYIVCSFGWWYVGIKYVK